MIGSSGLLAAVMAAASVSSLSLLCLLCLRCKRKSKIIHEENYIYNPQTLQHGGSIFAVTKSKTVTRANAIPSPTVETFDDFSPAATDEQSYYKNLKDGQTNDLEHTYVAPLPITVYENERTEISTTDANQTPGVYANVLLSSVNDDEDDYENSEFLNTVTEQQGCESEPDYENENEEWTR